MAGGQDTWAGSCRPRLCFVMHNGYRALSGASSGHIGGVERQQAVVGKWLAAHGWSVTALTWDEGQGSQCVCDGIRVISICRRDQGLAGLRFVHPKWTSLVRALAQAEADVYYHNCGESVTGQVAMWCRRHRRKFVYAVASDPDADARLPQMTDWRERALYRYGLRRADVVTVQTPHQQRMLKEGFGLESVVLPTPCPDPFAGGLFARQPPNGHPRVLWLGRVCRIKQPHLLLEIAQALPGVHFDLVGPADGSDYALGVLARAKQAPNVTVHGGVSFELVGEFLQKAHCVCGTSEFEGVPNAFLEAWCHGLPVVSTVDPGSAISSHGLGATGSDAASLSAGLGTLLEHKPRYVEASLNARKYFLSAHAQEAVMPLYEQVFVEACHAGPRVRSVA